MSNTIHAFDYLDSSPLTIPPIWVLFGDEAFLKGLVRRKLRDVILGHPAEAPYTSFDGDSALWRDVADELATVSLFGNRSKRLVIVQEADSFVSKYRSQLEDYVEHPRRTGVLALEVGTWASNTRLYKGVDKGGLQIDCRLPQKSVGRRVEVDETRLCTWLASWCESQHRTLLAPSAAQLLLELAGSDLGVLDQELGKLALFVSPPGKITSELVQKVIGGWRSKTMWEIVEAAADGDAGEALQQLDRGLQSGEHPQALFGQISWSLRRFAVATRIYERAERRRERITLREALQEAGFRAWPPDALNRAERQLKQLGRDRAGRLLSWLLEADLAMKGSHSSPHRARFVLERLFLRIARRATDVVR